MVGLWKFPGKIFERFSYFWETKFCEFCGFLGHPQNLIPTKTQKFDDSYNLMLTTFFVLSQPLYPIRKVSLGVFRNKISYTKLTWKFFFLQLRKCETIRNQEDYFKIVTIRLTFMGGTQIWDLTDLTIALEYVFCSSL